MKHSANSITFGAYALRLGLLACVAATASACGSDAVDAKNCEDLPLYEYRARFAGPDSGVKPPDQKLIDDAVQAGCISDVGFAQSLK